ncbi:Alpha/Beta hydrolase protein [Aspergillus recurvatus]
MRGAGGLVQQPNSSDPVFSFYHVHTQLERRCFCDSITMDLSTSTHLLPLLTILAVLNLSLTSAASLGAYNVDPDSVSISGFSSGGFMATQLGVAYSSVFKVGFGVFAGGPFDCARNQPNRTCMNNNTPAIKIPTENIQLWSGKQIDNIADLKTRKVYMQVGELDRITGPNVLSQLKSQLASFLTEEYTTHIVSSGAGHTFPAAFDSVGNNDCRVSESPFISDCGYDGPGEVLSWLYGRGGLKPKNKGKLKGNVLEFDQTGEFGAGARDSGMGEKGYLYVPDDCNGSSSTVCKLHVVLHGCCQSYHLIGDKFMENTGYNQWADANDIIVLYPQTTVDNSLHTIWDGGVHANPLACWDWIGLYGEDADQKGGVQMEAIVNQVKRIASGFEGGYSRADAEAEAISAWVSAYPDREL